MTSASIDRDLSAVQLELARAVAGPGSDQAGYLHLLLQRTCALLDAADGGVLLDDGEGALRVAAATDELAELVQRTELDLDQGPGVEAHRESRRVVEGDLAGSRRWPRLAPALREWGAAAVCALPLRWGEDAIGGRDAVSLPGRLAGSRGAAGG